MSHDNDPVMALLSSERLMALIDLHLGAPEDGPELRADARYARFKAQLGAKRFVVPIVGVQGSGKSSLVNALVFDDVVLPVDADETTCVPVEVRRAAGPARIGKVLFKDGHTEKVESSEAALAELVHNGRNPGNERAVDRVILEAASPVLGNGLVLVDLPGTGSLTAANLETTKSYLEEAVGVVFLLRTTPPLTASEARFLGLQWTRLQTAFFVQNRWTDDTDAAAEEGRATNVENLQKVAEACRIGQATPPTVVVVNAYRAMEGALKGDQALIERSGLSTLRSTLVNAGAEWPTLLRRRVVQAVSSDLRATHDAILVAIEQCGKGRVALEAEEAEEAVRFQAYAKDVGQRRVKAERDVEEMILAVSRGLKDWTENHRPVLRNNMRTKLRAGIVDGPRLERAMTDEQAEATELAFGATAESCLRLQDVIRQRFDDVVAWHGRKPTNFHAVKKAESFKWENAAEPVLGSAGGLGGAAAGAALGAPLGPPGMIIGGIIGGILGGLAGGLAGKLGKRAVTHFRAKPVEGEVFAAIDRFLEETVNELQDQAKAFARLAGERLVAWERRQHEVFMAGQARSRTVREASSEEKRVRGEALKLDLVEVGQALTQLEEQAP